MSDQVFTHSNTKFFIGNKPQNADLDLAAFKAIPDSDWTPVAKVGSIPERGINTNLLSYDTVNTLVSKKAKGITDAGDGTLEVARTKSDLGQQKLNAAGQPDNLNSYPIKYVKQDGVVEYGRCLIAGPSYPGGRNEDFDLANYALGFQQVPIEDTAVVGAVEYFVELTDPASFVLQAGSKSTGILDATTITDTELVAALAGFGSEAATVTGDFTDGFNVTLTDADELTGIGATVTVV